MGGDAAVKTWQWIGLVVAVGAAIVAVLLVRGIGASIGGALVSGVDERNAP